MRNGKLEIESGKWKMKNGKWKVESGKWKEELLPAGEFEAVDGTEQSNPCHNDIRGSFSQTFLWSYFV